MMWFYHDGMGLGAGWWMLAGALWTLLFWGIIIWLVVWGIRRLTGDRQETREEDPLEVARLRLARGEITREEYEELVEALRR